MFHPASLLLLKNDQQDSGEQMLKQSGHLIFDDTPECPVKLEKLQMNIH